MTFFSSVKGLDVEPFVESHGSLERFSSMVKPRVEAMLRTFTLLRSLTGVRDRKPQQHCAGNRSILGSSWALPP
jgi:hypothetical protein